MRLFGRQVILQIGSPGETGREFADLRMSFDVKMTDESTPSEAKVKVYNISAESRALAEADDAVVRLLVGYSAPILIFQGNPVDGGVTLNRSGADRILKLELQDGGREYKTSRISTTFSTPTTAKQAFGAVADTLGIPIGQVDIDESIKFNGSLTLNGPSRNILDDLAEISGAKWQIRDGTLYVIGNGNTTGEPAVVFRGTSGGLNQGGNMIGSPTLKDGEVEVKALLSPSLRPGDPFRVESEDVSGDYKATSVQFRGDSGFANDFYTIVRGTPL